jgi:hypothetical protein
MMKAVTIAPTPTNPTTAPRVIEIAIWLLSFSSATGIITVTVCPQVQVLVPFTSVKVWNASFALAPHSHSFQCFTALNT